MSYIQHFVAFLSSQKNKPSAITIKNYKADVMKFIAWYEKDFEMQFDPIFITKEIIDIYSKQFSLSARSKDRHLSSLRKFFRFLKEANSISLDPMQQVKPDALEATKDPWKLTDFKDYLYLNNKSNLTIKNYVMDVAQFLDWLSKTIKIEDEWDVDKRNILQKITPAVIEEYKYRLLHFAPTKENKLGMLPQSINRKLSSLRVFMSFLRQKGLHASQRIMLPSNIPDPDKEAESRDENPKESNILLYNDSSSYSWFPPIRLFQKSLSATDILFDAIVVSPLDSLLKTGTALLWHLKGKPIFTRTSLKQKTKQAIPFDPILATPGISKSLYAPTALSLAGKPFHKKVFHHIRYSRPSWYRKYHSYTIVHYFHLAILVIFASSIGLLMYQKLVVEPGSRDFALASPTGPSRFLTFQGRLTDPLDNPISKSKQIRFGIYNDKSASGSALVWEEVNTVNPDSNGVFSLLLGKTKSLPQSVFGNNKELWLGITIGHDQELAPRQQLANVASATNSELLQGLAPITQTGAGVKNVVLALDSSGNLTMGPAANPTFQAIGGQFKLSGQPLILTTNPGTNANIQILPDGTGKIDIGRPFFNSSQTATNAGALEIADLVVVTATSSSQSAFIINQTGTSPIISASASGVLRFIVENSGTGYFAGNLGIGKTSPAYRVDIATTIASDRALNIAHTAATGTNYGVYSSVSGAATTNIGGYFSATSSATARGLEVGSMSSADSTGLWINSLSGSSTVVGVNIGAISGGGSGKGILFGAISSTGSTNYGIYLDTLTGASSKNYQITTGTITAIASATNIQLNLAGISGTAASSTNYAISTGDISSTGTTNAALNLGAVSGAAATNYGINIANISGGTSNNYGIYLAGPASSATGAYGIYSAGTARSYFGGNVGIGDTNPGNTLKINGSVCIKDGQGSCAGTTAGTIYAGNTSVQSADLAENYLSSQELEPGDVVSLSDDEHSMAVVKSTGSYQGSLIGIVSTKPGVTLNSDAATDSAHPYVYPLGLSGRVPVKVTLENGPIAKGDYLSSSSTPGVAMRATKPGIVIGKALENYNGTGQQNKILSFVNIMWYDPGTPQENRANLTAFSNIIAKTIKTGILEALEITVNTFAATSATIEHLGAKSVTADYIVSPIAEIGTLKTNILSPLAKNAAIDIALKESVIEIRSTRNATSAAVASIDNAGNATFSGTIAGNNLSVENNASISGTLRAGRIIADQIEGLRVQAASIAASSITNITNIYNSSPSASVDPFANIASYSAELAYVDGLDAIFGTFREGLIALGPASLTDVSIANTLSIGENRNGLILADNSISVLGGTLELQPFRQGGISFLSGLFTIDQEGNVRVEGNTQFKKDVTVKGTFAIQNASGSAVLSMNHLGDLISSGSATINKLNFNLAEPAIAVSESEVIATGSAGIATVSAQQSQLTIKNANVTDKSLIYVTPLGNTDNLVLFILRQIPGVSFSIGISEPAAQPIPFNWMIIN